MTEPKIILPTPKKSRVRFPTTLWITKIIFEPEFEPEPTLTAYDLELDEEDMIFLYKELGNRLKNKHIKATRIQFIGMLGKD